MIKVVTNGCVPIPLNALDSMSILEYNVYGGLISLEKRGIKSANWKEIAGVSHTKSYTTLIKTMIDLKKDGWLKFQNKGDKIEFEVLYEQELPEMYSTTINKRAGEIKPVEDSEYTISFGRKVRRKKVTNNE